MGFCLLDSGNYWGSNFCLWHCINYLGCQESSNYYDSLINGFDLREFFSRWPPRPEPGALITGGWIAIAVGIVVAAFSGLLYWLSK